MMNCTECCKTLGCNCGGTCSAEVINKYDPIVVILALVFAVILTYLINRWVTKQYE
jgi:hypothetical protein